MNDEIEKKDSGESEEPSVLVPIVVIVTAILVLIGLITLVLKVAYDYSKISTESESVRQVEVAGAEEPIPTAIPFDSEILGLGVFNIGSQAVRLNQAFARYDTRIGSRSDSSLSGMSLGDTVFKVVEIALFRDNSIKLPVEEYLKQESFFTDSRRSVVAPDVLLELSFKDTATLCNSKSLKKARMAYRNFHSEDGNASPSHYEEFLFDPAGVAVRGTFKLECDFEDLSSLRLEARTQSLLKDEKELSWDFALITELNKVKNLGSNVFSEFAEAVALWQPENGKLQIGFFPKQISLKDKVRIRNGKSILSLSDHKPEMYAEMMLKPRSRKVSFDLIQKGYQVTFLSRKGGQFTFPGKSKLSVEFPEGERPMRMDGTLNEGRRIIGRLQGSHTERFSKGKYQFRWAVPFNAVVLVSE